MKSHHKISSIFFIFLLLISSSGTSSNLILFDFFVPAYAVDGGVISQEISLEHDHVNGRYNSLVQVDSDTYALAYNGPASRGTINTFTIPTDGSAITEVISLEHNSFQTLFNSLVQVDSDTYALAYTGTGDDGFIKTFTINPTTGAITAVATLEHDTADGTYNSLVQVDSDTYALAYTGTGDDGFIKTFTINPTTGAITAVATLEHDTADGTYNSLIQVDSDTYALAYAGFEEDGFIKTFTIPTDGSTITEVATLEHDTADGTHNSLTKVTSNTYALAYTGTNSDGIITTFTIPTDGSAITEVTSLAHATDTDGWGKENSLVQVDSDTYALAYAGDSNDGFIKTFTISESVVETETTVAASVSSSDKSESSQYKEEKMLRTPDESFYFEEADYSEIASESLAVPINSAVIEPVIETFETVSAPEKVEATPEDT